MKGLTLRLAVTARPAGAREIGGGWVARMPVGGAQPRGERLRWSPVATPPEVLWSFDWADALDSRAISRCAPTSQLFLFMRAAAVSQDARLLNASLAASSTASAVLSLVEAHLASLNDVHCATALSRLARASDKCEPHELQALLLQTATALSSFESNGRTLTAIAHGLATLDCRDDQLLAAVCRAVTRLPVRDVHRAGALATLLNAFGTLRLVPPEAQSVCEAAAQCAPLFSSSELANAAWGAAAAGLRSPPLLDAFAGALVAKAAELTPQGLSNSAWAFAKLRQTRPPLSRALKAAAVASLARGSFAQDPRSFATLAWAYAREPDARLNAAVCTALEPLLCTRSLPFQSAVSLLHSLGGTRSAGGETPAAGVSPDVLSLLASAALDGLARASAQELGVICAAIARSVVSVPAEQAAPLAKTLAARARLLVSSLDWRAVASVELSLRLLCGVNATTPGEKSMRYLAVRAAECADAASAAASRAASAPRQLLLSHLTTPELDRSCWHSVLLVGSDPDGHLSSLLVNCGAQCHHWRRFASDAAAATASEAASQPAMEPGSADAAVLQLPGSLDAARHALHACAACMRTGARLLVSGRADEGASLAAVAALSQSLFSSLRCVAASPDCSSSVFDCIRSGGLAKASLPAWRTVLPPLPGSAASQWITYPGLFAGGALDVMTSALAGVVPLSRRARVLDFACGSGALAALLLARDASLRLTLLDSDALALEAARENLPSARVVLADCWSGLSLRRRFRIIVANPPIHSGAADSFDVLCALLRCANERLLPGGSLWLVAQAQVPVGRLAAPCGFASVEPHSLCEGRFIAWQAVAPDAADECGKKRKSSSV